MKNVFLGAVLIAFAFGCKSNSNQSVTDPKGANMPKAECNKGACEGMKDGKGCEGMKAEGQKPSCCEKKPQG
jgi:hypothetical protein